MTTRSSSIAIAALWLASIGGCSDGMVTGMPADAAAAGDGGGGQVDAATPVFDAGVPAVHFVGRIDDSDPSSVRFAWPGTGAIVRFEGTGARVRLDDPARYFTVVVDGEVQPRLATSSGEQLYDLASGLPPGVHTIELYRRTEGGFGATKFLGFELDGTMLPPPPVERRIELLGDSITCGYGNEGADQYCNFSADTENHYLTYGAIAARAVGAELSTIAWSGKGVIYNYGDDVVEPLPEVYDRTIPLESGTTWDFGWQPDVVLINLGTNDFSTDNDPTEPLFVGAYVDLLDQIRLHYPGARILCTVAPLLGEPDSSTVLGYIDEAIAQRAAAGDTNVARVDLDATNDGWGCDWHPSIATHQAMATKLETVLADELGW